ncbi:hypothetical protein Poly51_24430 [Rubripirellula tenax]|uniref:Pseudopilin GspJ n=1 Tax=Rubripirellula tenax TaxID=2528015 RepID=A0A5C6F6C1_9BACT|nr:hypothetical protein [Rubripirellula tenax]TWU56532.1 hypothetical protein Poly51_24430 [Rubripirellula tenax]
MRNGITLMEVVVSTVLVSGVLLVAMTTSANLWRNRGLQNEHEMAADLSGQMLDEITSKAFRDSVAPVFGIETDETGLARIGFDDVDDYHGFTESPPMHRDGQFIDGCSGWSIEVIVQPATPTTDGIEASATPTVDSDAGLRLVTVHCTTPTGHLITDVAVVSDVPGDEAETASFQRWRNETLTFSDGSSLRITAPLRNRPILGVGQ